MFSVRRMGEEESEEMEDMVDGVRGLDGREAGKTDNWIGNYFESNQSTGLITCQLGS